VTREYQRGKYYCTIDLLFDLFGLACFANKKRDLSVVIQPIPNQSNRKSIVQYSLEGPMLSDPKCFIL
jgi:hypothetical protein